MGIDEAGQDGSGAAVVDDGVGGKLRWVADGADVGALDEQGSGACALRGYDSVGEECMCHII